MSLSDQGTRNPIPLTVDVPARLVAINQRKLRAYRLERLRAELHKRDYAGCLLADPINIRYATGSRNMTLWTMHAPSRWAFVPTQGPVVLYEFTSSMHVNEGLETIAEMRPCTPWLYFLAGQRSEEKAMLWADEIADMVATHGGKNRRLAVDRCEPTGAFRLAQRGLEVFDAPAGPDIRTGADLRSEPYPASGEPNGRRKRGDPAR